ncbi:MAG: bifunctional YncE family protein/alkaline phosphatase family protein [Bacteroidota bacterium]
MISRKIIGLAVVSGLLAASCHQPKRTPGMANAGQVNQHSSYDDSTLHQTTLPVLMPYNRIIDPAGTVLRYGEETQENHSLDLKLIPGTNLMAVEDRYGIAVVNTATQKVADRWIYTADAKYRGLMSTYSGLEVYKTAAGEVKILWSAANGGNHQSYVMEAGWDGQKLSISKALAFKPEGESPLALPNELLMDRQNGVNYLYVVLNGNNKLVKVDWDKQAIVWSKNTGVAPYGLAKAGNNIYVSNWGGPQVTDTIGRETAGVPYGKAYTDPKTGAISLGSVSVFESGNGNLIKELATGLHPNDIVTSTDGKLVYVANGNSDNISVISTVDNKIVQTIDVSLHAGEKGFIGDTPNALALSDDGNTLYVANGLDNAVAVIHLGSKAAAHGSGSSNIKGFIPTEAYPAGLAIKNNTLFVTNLEGEGARVNAKDMQRKPADLPATKTDAFNTHRQLATLSFIPLPDDQQLAVYTQNVNTLNLAYRAELARLLPRKDIAPVPVPERIGEPSVFQHVIYIVKENRTYDQVLGDIKTGDGNPDLCIFGEQITPNEHQLAKDFLLMDNYYASGKSSAEGHQWTDAAMVTDYVEKSVRAWFRSYPHVQEDAMVYDKKGFIWNNAADHGKNVRVYGETATPHVKKGMTWLPIYNDYIAGKPLDFTNTSTIARVRPLLSPNYPGYDDHDINDQIRASAFIKELNDYEKQPGDKLPNLMVLALPADHTGGTTPRLPTPRAMVADNDLALGRIVEAVSKSRFWKNTVIFVTEDDSQAGWDHVSAYRTTGFVISPYSRLKQTVHTNYNQTCIVRTIEQILGIPPMNTIDATALPMFSCFSQRPDSFVFTHVANKIPLNEMNPKLSMLKGIDLYYAQQSMTAQYAHIDGGNDDLLNRIIWNSVMGKKTYPKKFAGHDTGDDDDDD